MKIDIKGILQKAQKYLQDLTARVNVKNAQGLMGRINIKNVRQNAGPFFRDILKDKRKLFTAIGIIIAVIIFAKMTMNIQKALFKKKEAPAKAAAVSFEEESTPVKVFKIKKTDFKDTLPVIGNIKGFQESTLRFQASGIIESWNFEEGEKVQEGDIIASLNQRDQLLKLKYSEVEMKKNQKLFEIGAITPMKLEQSKLEYESAKSDFDKTNIYALANGYLASKDLDVGSYVNTGTQDRVGVFVSIDKVYGEFNVIEKDMPKIALGQKVDVFVDAFPTKAFNGTVDRIAPIVEGRSRTQKVSVDVENKENLLKPGMFVRALIYTYEKKDVIVVPSSALKKKEADYFAFIVNKEPPKKEAVEDKAGQKKKGFWIFGAPKTTSAKEKEKPPAPAMEQKEKEPEFGTIEVKKLKLGYMTQDLIEVDEGLKEDDLIVVEVQEEFKDKARVEIMEVQEGLI